MHEQVALNWLLLNDELPLECCDCPFATVSHNEEPPNPVDRGEGFYDCALLHRERVWGENPQCVRADWRLRARDELGWI
jgi:hypothetical protein